MEASEINVKQTATVEIPTDRGKKLVLQRDGDQVTVTYTGFKTPVVTLEQLREGIGRLGE